MLEISRRNRSFPSVLEKAIVAFVKDSGDDLAAAAVFAAHSSLLEEAGARDIFAVDGNAGVLSKVGCWLNIIESWVLGCVNS